MSQFKRRALVVLQTNGPDLVIEGLRISFTVTKSFKFPKAEVSIYNLSKDTRNKIDTTLKSNKKIFLKVGYDDPDRLLTTIIEGNPTRHKHHFDQPNVITKFEITDGFVEGETPLSFSGKENTNFYDALKKVCKEAKLEIDFRATNITDLKNKILSTGYAFTGKLKEAIDELTNSVEVDWSMDAGKVKIITRGKSLPGTALLIDETSGMIGTPEFIDDLFTKTGKQKKKNANETSVAPGYVITSLLNPSIVIGTPIHIKSNKLNLDYETVVHDVTHEGDTYGNEWFSRMKVATK